MQDFEKLGRLYLGKRFSFEQGLQDELVLYDSKDLTTHAVCVGMTGSGKTGLCLSLIEEALIDNIPVIAIDPKGDLSNLLLTFPQLTAAEFRPWIDEGAAARQGMSAEEFAADTAAMWSDGLAEWGQDATRIAKLRQDVDMTIYTPGSSAGVGLTVLRSFDAPSPAVLNDSDALRERVSSSTSGLLALLGIDADPVRSREHILIANILHHVWQAGRNLDIPQLIHSIQQPPFDKVGVFDLDTFFPAKDRLGLAMAMNNLLASPSFQSWLEGDALDIQRLLYTSGGQPRLSVISIAHLSDSERMFFVTILLNEILAWVRSQQGTSSLRALLYMDEVFGYFPPVANPPSKQPMLTLLKQARAFGLGVMLATQNPVDLDYKGLSNTGTWFLGRLQTERDKMRVLEGLEGASAQAGSTFDRQQMEATLAGLGSRVFLMNNVHEDAPVVFQTRWALSYLRGPLSREQISRLMEAKKRAAAEEPSSAAPTAADPAAASSPSTSAPGAVATGADESGPATTETVAPREVPPTPADGVEVRFLPPAIQRLGSANAQVQYQPALLGRVRLHYVRSSYGVDQWNEQLLLAAADGPLDERLWERAEDVDPAQLDLQRRPAADARFPRLADDLLSQRNYASWARQLKDHCYRQFVGTLWRCADPKAYSRLNETEGDFRVRLRLQAHEMRDQQVEKVRDKYRSRMQTLQERLRSAEDRKRREQAEYGTATVNTAVSIGSSILGALFGRKVGRRASTSARQASQAAKQRSDVRRAEDRIRDLETDAQQLQRQLADEVDAIEAAYRPESLALEQLTLAPRKSDIDVVPLTLVWTPVDR